MLRRDAVTMVNSLQWGEGRSDQTSEQNLTVDRPSRWSKAIAMNMDQ